MGDDEATVAAPTLHWIGRVQYPPVAVGSRAHCHDFHELVLVAQGTYRVELDDATRTLEPGAYILYPAETRHHPVPRTDFAQLYVLQWRGPRPTTEPLLAGVDEAHRLRMALEWIWSGFPPVDEPTRRLHGALLEVILAAVQRPAPSNEGDAMAQVERYLRLAKHATISMAELAAFIGMSERNLLRAYKNRYGLSPKQHLRRMRVERAANLLLSTQLSIQEVADAVGYADVQSFRRQFRQIHGLPPRVFRASGD